MDIIKDNAVDKKSFWLAKNTLLLVLLINPVRNTDVTKWDNFYKIKTPSEKINNSKKL